MDIIDTVTGKHHLQLPMCKKNQLPLQAALWNRQKEVLHIYKASTDMKRISLFISLGSNLNVLSSLVLESGVCSVYRNGQSYRTGYTGYKLSIYILLLIIIALHICRICFRIPSTSHAKPFTDEKFLCWPVHLAFREAFCWSKFSCYPLILELTL